MRRFTLATVCCVLVFGGGCRPLSQHPLVAEAVDEVMQNERVAATLGAPVTYSKAVRGTANETDGIASLQFDVAGAKAKGVVAVEGKKTRGQWGVTLLELRPDGGGEHLHLSQDLVARTGTDTPTFDPAAKPATASPPAPPPGDIEIALPPGPPGQ
ncbi:MAG: cytochrome c oxidase assembly factor Coa1 family protein [Pirellulales bacterium]